MQTSSTRFYKHILNVATNQAPWLYCDNAKQVAVSCLTEGEKRVAVGGELVSFARPTE